MSESESEVWESTVPPSRYSDPERRDPDAPVLPNDGENSGVQISTATDTGAEGRAIPEASLPQAAGE